MKSKGLDFCNICGKWSVSVNNVDPGQGPHICKECMAQLDEKAMKEEWFKNDQELRVAILQVLYFQRLRKPQKRTRESSISDILALTGVFKIGPTLSWLSDNGYIEATRPDFAITDLGVQFVLAQVPELKRFSAT